MDKRLKAVGVEPGEEKRRALRELLFTTEGVAELHQRRHPLRRDVPPEHRGRHAVPAPARRPGHRARHQGRHGRQAARGRRRREGHRGPRRPARAARRVLRAAARGSRSGARSSSIDGERPERATASTSTPTRSPATPRSARRRASCRSSSPRCSWTATTRSTAPRRSPASVLAGASSTELHAPARRARRDAAEAEHGGRRLRVLRAGRATRRSPSATLRMSAPPRARRRARHRLPLRRPERRGRDRAAEPHEPHGPAAVGGQLLLRPRPAGGGARDVARRGRQRRRRAGRSTATARAARAPPGAASTPRRWSASCPRPRPDALTSRRTSVASPKLGGRRRGVALEARALVERRGEHVDEALERREVAGRRGRQRLLDEVVARDVDRVDAVHRLGDRVRVGRRPTASRARQRSDQRVEGGGLGEQRSRGLADRRAPTTTARGSTT